MQSPCSCLLAHKITSNTLLQNCIWDAGEPERSCRLPVVRIHSVSTCVNLSMSQEAQGISATTNSKLVLFILLAWKSL